MLKSAQCFIVKDRCIEVPDFSHALPMAQSMGFGVPLVSQNGFGADLIHFKAGEGVPNHTHAGDHILFGVAGEGYVIYQGTAHRISPGFCYFVPGDVDHAIKAETDLTLIACGNKHFSVDSKQRIELVSYRLETSADFRVGERES